jgi:integrase/recombinase XerD
MDGMDYCTVAVAVYLRKGGSVFHLQKVLRHSSLEMTRRYTNLMTEDLQAIHQRVSLLAA